MRGVSGWVWAGVAVVRLMACLLLVTGSAWGESLVREGFFSGWQRWKLFCNFWSVRWLVRIVNVLTPVHWLICIVLKKVDTFFIDNPTTSLQFIC